MTFPIKYAFNSGLRRTRSSLNTGLLMGLAVLLVASAGRDGMAADPAEVLPEHTRVESLTSPAEFFGFPIGSRHLRHDQVLAYMEKLASESDRVVFQPYATSHGGRTLFVLLITSPANHADLESIRKRHLELASGTIAAPREDDRTVMYLGYGVHGDEASALNATPLVAYHLASSTSPTVTELLDGSVLLLDPCLNPDGGSRFAHWVNENRGRIASTDPVDREHQQGWPGGRTNYYWFDLNRDWLPATHPESRGRLKLFHQWKPNVALDYHEMGSSSSYFFQPGVRARTNPLTPARNVELTKLFAIEHAKRMDEAGELFFTEERFDDFYVGKGSTYPDVNGGIGILFEQGSSRGLRVETDRTNRTFSDSIANQVRTSLSSLDSLGRLSQELLKYQCDFFRSARQRGSSLDSFVLSGEASRVKAAKELMELHDIEISQPAESILVDGRLHDPNEVLIISLDQPQATLIQSMMSTAQSFDENVFYDVSTWHLPSAFDLDVRRIARSQASEWQASEKGEVTASQSPGIEFQEETLGYVIPPTSLQVPKLIASLHRANAKLRVTTMPIEIAISQEETITLPHGSLLVLRQPNGRAWPEVIKRLQSFDLTGSTRVIPLSTSMTPSGPDLGSDSMLDLVVAKPALIVGEGTSAYTAGSIWHHLDVRLEQPTTLIDTTDFSSVDLQDYTSIIFPNGTYGLWGESQATKLKRYMERGGVVIAIGDSIDWLAKKEVVKLMEDHDHEEEPQREESVNAFRERPFGGARNRSALESIAGAMFEVEIDPTHPLAYGFTDSVVPVFRRGQHHYQVPKNSYQTAGVYRDVISGYVSEANRQLLKDTAAVFSIPVGRGRVIVLADNPVFRGYVRSTEPFLSNAIYLGPSFRLPRASNDEHEHDH